MTYTDGIIIRCPCCGALNVVQHTDETLRKCLVCGGSINPLNSIIYKQTEVLIP